jgi:hypothetical protein
MRIAHVRLGWGLLTLLALIPFSAVADDESCRQLMKELPIEDYPSDARRWSDDTVDGLLKHHIVPPLWGRAAQRLRDEFGEDSGSTHDSIEIGRNKSGAIGVFESVFGGGRCIAGFALVERKGRFELGAEFKEPNAACGAAGIELIETDDGALPTVVDASNSTDGKQSSILYYVLSSSWPVANGQDVECVVRAVYANEFTLEWPEGARLRDQLQPVVLAVMQAGDVHGKKADIARAFASLASPRSNSQADTKLQELLEGDKLSSSFSQRNWTPGSEPRWPEFDAVARRVVVNGQSYVLAVGRHWAGTTESPPTFMLLGWDGSSYVSLVEGAADVESKFDHAELLDDQSQE